MSIRLFRIQNLKFFDRNLAFSAKMRLEDLVIVGSINNSAAHYLKYSHLKNVYKKWCIFSRNLQKFGRILRSI